MFAKRTNWDLEPNALAKALAEHRAAGKPLIDLTVSNPTECGFTYDAEAILAALQNPAALKYEPDAKGLELARRAVAGYYADRGDAVSVEDIFLTTSTSEGYSWLMRLLCDAGDEVLIPAPGYPLFDFLADLNDVRLVRYPLFYDHGWHFDLHAIEQAITARTRAVIVVHPNNPTGNYVKPQEREQLNAICAERGLALIADEVFLDFALDGVPRASFATNGNVARSESGDAGDDRGFVSGRHAPLTFTLSGISKICGLPQMKVAWLVVSGRGAARTEAVARLEMIADTYLSMNAPVQLAVPEMLSGRLNLQKQIVERARRNMAELDALLGGQAESRLRRLDVEGGWSAVLRAATEPDTDGWARELLAKRGVVVHPGHFYGLSGEDSIVISLLTPPAQFEVALARLLGPELRRR